MDEIQFIRDLADGARTINRMVIEWHADRVRVQLGQATIVEPETPGARMVHCLHACAPYGHFHWVIDNPIP